MKKHLQQTTQTFLRLIVTKMRIVFLIAVLMLVLSTTARGKPFDEGNIQRIRPAVETSWQYPHHRHTEELSSNGDSYPEDFYTPPSTAPTTTTVPKRGCQRLGRRRTLKSTKADDSNKSNNKLSTKTSKDSSDSSRSLNSKRSSRKSPIESSKQPTVLPTPTPSFFPSFSPSVVPTKSPIFSLPTPPPTLFVPPTQGPTRSLQTSSPPTTSPTQNDDDDIVERCDEDEVDATTSDSTSNSNNHNNASPIVEQGIIAGSDASPSSSLEQLSSRAANSFGGKSTKTMSLTAVVSMLVIGILVFDACGVVG